EQHVGGKLVVSVERRSPGHFKLPAPPEAGAAGDRLVTQPGAAKPGFGKRVRDGLEKTARLCRGSQISHVRREDFEEGIDLVSPETDLDPFLLRAPDLAAELGVEALEERL